MAKIIDFKTRQVLAEFPQEATPRLHTIWSPQDSQLGNKFAIIASNETEAMMTLQLAQYKNYADAKKTA